MAVSIFKGVIPVEDWSETTKSVLSSFNRADEKYHEQERYEEQQKEKHEAEFMELAKVNPVSILSQKLQKQQADNIQQFISMAGEEYRKSNYKPTLQQKLKIQQAKDNLQSWQGNVLSSQKMWQQAYDVIQKDRMKGDYDEKHFWDKTNEFYDSGILPTDLLNPKPYGDVDAELMKKKYSGRIVKNIATVDKNGIATTHEKEVIADEDERKAQMAGLIHDDVRMGASAMKEFSELPPETKKKYLDEASENKENAIINYFHDKHNHSLAPKLSEVKVAPVRTQGLGISSVTSIEDEPVGYLPLERKGSVGNKLVAKTHILRQVNISQPTTISVSGMNTWDEKGEKQPLTAKKGGEYTTLKDISIVYVPVDVENDKIVPTDAYKVNGKIRPNIQIKPFVQGKENGKLKLLEYTPELQNKINAAIPSTKAKISEEDAPFDWKPTENEIKSQKVKKTSYIYKGKKYSYDDLINGGFTDEDIKKALLLKKLK
jgi:hypothetical protein